MGRGRSKGKTQKGKASGSRRHPEAARLHAQEVNAKRRADGKETKSTSSISRSQRRAQQHHEAKAKPVPAPTENRSRSPVRGTTAKAKAVEESSSYYEETDAEPSQPSAAPKAGESLPGGAGRPQPEEPRASGVKRVPAKGEFLPKAETPKAGESLPGQEDHSQRSRAPQESRGYQPRVSFSPRQRAQPRIQRSGARPLGRVSLSPPQGHRQDQRPLQLPRKTRQVATKEATDESQATGAGDAPKEAAASKTEQVDDSEDEYTSESTQEVPALQGTPLTTGARMWSPSQFPLTLKLVKQLQSGELLPEPIQLSRLGFGRTRAVFSLPASALPNTPQRGVLKLCRVRQHHGKEFEWGAHCSLVAPTYLKGQISVDFGVQARYLHFSVQRKTTLASDWVAQFGGNVSLTHDLALYALSTLLALELRGAVLCDVGPSNLMVRAPTPYPQMTYGDVAGWSVHHKIRHRGVGNFESVLRSFPSDPDRTSSGSARSQATGLEGCLQNSSQQVRQVRCPPGK